jgi:hypothetical protein
MPICAYRHVLFSSLIVLYLLASPLPANEEDEHEGSAKAPPNTVDIAKDLGGSYFVDKELVNQKKLLQNQLKKIRDQIVAGAIDSATALNMLTEIEKSLETVRDEIERQKVLVSAFNVYRQTKEELIEFGDDKMLIVNSDKIKIRSWDGPGIKTVLEKIIIAKEKPADKDFAEISVEHKLEIPEEIVGQTKEQRADDRRKFSESAEGKKLTAEQLEFRLKLYDEIDASLEKFTPFQGKRCNVLRLRGLSGDQGNKNLSIRIESPGGGGTHSFQWQRHASLTVYVPQCNWIAVNGCLVGIDIAEIESNLLLTVKDSRERDYDGKFEVLDVTGDVVIDQAPVRTLVGVKGNVDMIATDEFVNSGTRHADGTRTAYSFSTASTEIIDVTGDLHAHFLRTNLQIKTVRGVIDVQNEFGDTKILLDESTATDKAHRIISESGIAEVSGSEEKLQSMPIYAHTLCGTIVTDQGREILDDISFSTGAPRRNWSGFVTPSKERFSLAKFERPAAALQNKSRAAGLDLISKSGAVKILSVE